MDFKQQNFIKSEIIKLALFQLSSQILISFLVDTPKSLGKTAIHLTAIKRIQNHLFFPFQKKQNLLFHKILMQFIVNLINYEHLEKDLIFLFEINQIKLIHLIQIFEIHIKLI